MKGEHRVQPEADPIRQPGEVEVRGPVVEQRAVPLDDAPPDVHHHPFDPRALQARHALGELIRPLELPVPRDRIEREHHVHRHAPGAPWRTHVVRGTIIFIDSKGRLLERPEDGSAVGARRGDAHVSGSATATRSSPKPLSPTTRVHSGAPVVLCPFPPTPERAFRGFGEPT